MGDYPVPSIVRTYSRRQPLAARRGNLLIGCLAVLGVIAALVIIGGVIVWMNWKGWAGGAMNAGMKAVVAEANMPAEQVGRINIQIDQLTGAFEAGDVTMEDLVKVVEAMEHHPILPIGVLEYIEFNSLQAAGLTDEEKAAGTLATQRLQRAFIDGQMVLDDLDPLLEPISQRDSDGNLQPIQNPTAPQVRLYIEAAEKKADELGVPNEPYDVDLAEQIERLINDTLGREVVSAPAAAPALPPADGDQPEIEDPEPETPDTETGGG